MFVILFLLWLILNGRVTLEIFLLGILVAGAVYCFLWKVMGYTPRTEGVILRNVPWALLYLGNLILEVVKAARDVIEVSFNPMLSPDPIIVEFHSGLPRDIQNVFLANSITLTPGTITVFQENDFFVVHCLRREYAKGIEQSSFIRLLGRMH